MEVSITPPLSDSVWRGAHTWDFNGSGRMCAFHVCVCVCGGFRRAITRVVLQDFDQPLRAKDSTTINNRSSTNVVIYVGDEHNTAGSAGCASLCRRVCLVNERIHHPLTHAADLHLMYRNIKILNAQ